MTQEVPHRCYQRHGTLCHNFTNMASPSPSSSQGMQVPQQVTDGTYHVSLSSVSSEEPDSHSLGLSWGVGGELGEKGKRLSKETKERLTDTDNR